ncbi:MAG: metalloregulator ArsR/SmtB family transcription factor [Thermodesulfobacteriota bacterium]
MRQAIATFKAAGDETRLRILALLAQGELCVCDLMAVLELPQSTVSRHLAVLRQAGWVSDRRQGVWMHYRLADGDARARSALQQALLAYLRELPAVRGDRQRLARYLSTRDQHSCG